MNIRLYNARILTMEKARDIFQGEIWIKNDKIVYVSNAEQENTEWSGYGMPHIQWDYEYDCKNNLLMPGFKNAHTHSAMTLFRSLADDLPLDQWLKEKVFPLEEKLTDDDIYEFTRLAIMEYVTSGITSIFDMYIRPDVTAEACMDSGMRCVLTSGLNDFTSSIEKQEDEYVRLNNRHPLISYQLGFHAEYTCSKELLYDMTSLAHKYRAPVFMHLAETKKEVAECQARYGMTPAMFLDGMGMFEYGGGAFHCVHMSEGDYEVFKMRRLSVITNPASNLKLASGIAPVADFLKQKINVAIGTDGAGSNNCLDMFREMFLVSALSKVREEDAASIDAGKVLRMATVYGAKAMGISKADVLAKGKLADMILIDLNQPNMQPVHNIPKNLVYSGSKSNVIMTMVGGKILYNEGHFNIGESPEHIYGKCAKIVQRLLG